LKEQNLKILACVSHMAQIQKTKKYRLCCISNFAFSRPETPWVVYTADITNGLVVGRWEIYAAKMYDMAKQWIKRYC